MFFRRRLLDFHATPRILTLKGPPMKSSLFALTAALSLLCAFEGIAQTPAAPAAQDGEDAAARKPTLGVMPITVGNSVEVNFGDIKITPEIIENEFTGQMIEFLSKSRKFNLVERQRLRRVIDECRLTESEWVKPGEAARIGKLLVADYLVLGNIDRLSIINRPVDIPLTGEKSVNMSVVMKFGFRIVEVKSGSIVFAQTVEDRVRSEDIRASVPYSERKDWTWADYKDILFKRCAINSGNAILEGIYPVKVASVQGQEAVLNRGQGAGISAGDIFEIFNPGKGVVDPDTKEALGFEELKVGTLAVFSVEPKFSKARIVSAEGTVLPGAICRRVRPADPAQEAVPYPKRDTPSW